MTLITESAALAAFCERQAKAEFIAVDTEFLRDNTYWPKLCLVQVGGPEEVAAIDTLAPGMDLKPLLDLLYDPALLKVFHSARQDLEIFYHMTGRLPAPVFDTQVAAMVCGFGDSVSYEILVRKLAGAKIDKASRFADWSHRPLTKRQLDYALADVIHLRPAYKKLKTKLGKNGRAEWLREEMDVLTDPATYDLAPQGAWRRLKTRSTDGRYLAVLRALATSRRAAGCCATSSCSTSPPTRPRRPRSWAAPAAWAATWPKAGSARRFWPPSPRAWPCPKPNCREPRPEPICPRGWGRSSTCSRCCSKCAARSTTWPSAWSPASPTWKPSPPTTTPRCRRSRAGGARSSAPTRWP
jgi:hypothetical protein